MKVSRRGGDIAVYRHHAGRMLACMAPEAESNQRDRSGSQRKLAVLIIYIPMILSHRQNKKTQAEISGRVSGTARRRLQMDRHEQDKITAMTALSSGAGFAQTRVVRSEWSDPQEKNQNFAASRHTDLNYE